MLAVNAPSCLRLQRRVQDVISPIVFEAAYSLGVHQTAEDQRELPDLTPVLRWKKGQKIAQKNQTVFERNCRSEDCAADLQLRGKLLLSGVDEKTPYLALGAVKNISLNISISNLGDDAYDANVSFNVSRELFFINMWQKLGSVALCSAAGLCGSVLCSWALWLCALQLGSVALCSAAGLCGSVLCSWALWLCALQLGSVALCSAAGLCGSVLCSWALWLCALQLGSVALCSAAGLCGSVLCSWALWLCALQLGSVALCSAAGLCGSVLCSWALWLCALQLGSVALCSAAGLCGSVLCSWALWLCALQLGSVALCSAAGLCGSVLCSWALWLCALQLGSVALCSAAGLCGSVLCSWALWLCALQLGSVALCSAAGLCGSVLCSWALWLCALQLGSVALCSAAGLCGSVLCSWALWLCALQLGSVALCSAAGLCGSVLCSWALWLCALQLGSVALCSAAGLCGSVLCSWALWLCALQLGSVALCSAAGLCGSVLCSWALWLCALQLGSVALCSAAGLCGSVLCSWALWLCALQLGSVALCSAAGLCGSVLCSWALWLCALQLGSVALCSAAGICSSVLCSCLRDLAEEEMGVSCELLESDFLKCSVGFPFMRSKSKYEFSVIFDTSHLSGEEAVLSSIVTAQSGNMERSEALHDNALTLTVPLVHEVDTSITGIVSPTSFVYGESVDASNFRQLQDQECRFQTLNITLQVYNTGPSTLPGASVSISFPSRLSPGGAEMFQVQEMVVSQEKGSCSFQRNPTPCVIPQEQENIFHTIFAFFTKSGRKVLDCEKPGSFCLTVRCNLSALPREESRTIDLYMLLNTEILKKDSSSVIQFMARAKVKVDPALRVVEIPNGNPEETLVVFEALHNLEPRGYVVGWIIAISLLVGILIFLLLAVLLWKVSLAPIGACRFPTQDTGSQVSPGLRNLGRKRLPLTVQPQSLPAERACGLWVENKAQCLESAKACGGDASLACKLEQGGEGAQRLRPSKTGDCYPRLGGGPTLHVVESWPKSAPPGHFPPSATHNLLAASGRQRCPQPLAEVPGAPRAKRCSLEDALSRTQTLTPPASADSQCEPGLQTPRAPLTHRLLRLAAHPSSTAPQRRAPALLQPRSPLPRGTLRSRFERQDVPHPEPTSDCKRLPRRLASGANEPRWASAGDPAAPGPPPRAPRAPMHSALRGGPHPDR
ncbi:hypothetical protein NN561_016898 [Cricetulus griseus]